MTINFMGLVEKIREEQGYCTLADRHYAAVDGVRIHCVTGKRTDVKVHWLIDWEDDRPVLWFLDGVTGYESYYVASLKKYWQDDERLCICAGTEGR